jgi:hypothetical protein
MGNLSAEMGRIANMKCRAALVVLSGTAVLGFLSPPAEAKALSIVSATIRGPGGPVLLGARALYRPHEGNLVDILFSGSPRSAKPKRLGPSYPVRYRLSLHLFEPSRSAVVKQRLYPYAEGGPVVFTPEGQRFRVSRSISAHASSGWYQVPPSVLRHLEDRGLSLRVAAASAETEVGLEAMGALWSLAIPVLVVAALLFWGRSRVGSAL